MPPLVPMLSGVIFTNVSFIVLRTCFTTPAILSSGIILKLMIAFAVSGKTFYVSLPSNIVATVLVLNIASVKDDLLS